MKSISIDIRLISATNDNLNEAVNDGRFRQDLLYRINTIEIRLPPLRERKEDIPLLINHYLKHFCQKYNRKLMINTSDRQRLSRYQWPGNVRELCHTIERAVILSDGETLDISSIISLPIKTEPTKQTLEQTTFNLDKVEELTIANALDHFKGNVSQAAKALGLTRGALYRRLEKYDL
jgi:DNA-binding NtrC family response regulator